MVSKGSFLKPGIVEDVGGELFSNSQHLNKLQRPLKIRGGNELYVEVQGRQKISPPESEDLENKSLPFDARRVWVDEEGGGCGVG
ncbi:hypothetical protein CEXT_510421 [Caerostris extrusa]|uniref:Uncharacterized protein n=1 Tax=Caerostris extrusa TaxID=172846 RepID=A0AAV4WVW2_CAEEX|nr:hypothetical protein CEXT_510421 [Caerostris extrusa]